jgi:molybdopterin-guanine dinucleotide biosynthesis protein B
MRRLHIVGGKKQGKTALMERLVGELTRRGLRVGTIKHSSHSHDIDTPGTDSHRHRTAGASPAAFVTPGGVAVYLSGSRSYDQIAPLFRDCHLVLVEGDRETDAPKVEVHEAPADIQVLADRIIEILGVKT